MHHKKLDRLTYVQDTVISLADMLAALTNVVWLTVLFHNSKHLFVWHFFCQLSAS